MHRKIHQYTMGDAANILGVPIYEARRTADRLWPKLPRIAGARVIDSSQLRELAAALCASRRSPEGGTT